MIIDLSGYSFTGKSAYYDLLSHSKGITSHSKEFEFDLLRVQGGLIDLYESLCNNWSPIRSSEAIRRFSRLIFYMGGNRSFFNRIIRYGPHYDYYIEKFTEKSEKFISRIILASWKAEWPFSAYNDSYVISILNKYIQKIYGNIPSKVYLSAFSRDEFIKICNDYLDDLFSIKQAKDGACLLLNNCFEPFNPEFGMQFFTNSRAIIVDRDPRDIYISAANVKPVNGVDVGSAVIGENVENFIKRFLIYRSKVILSNSTKVYRTKFENLILDFECELEKIRQLLRPVNIDLIAAANQFNHERSKRNVRQWLLPENKVYSNRIRLIEKRLPEFCFL